MWHVDLVDDVARCQAIGRLIVGDLMIYIYLIIKRTWRVYRSGRSCPVSSLLCHSVPLCSYLVAGESILYM